MAACEACGSTTTDLRDIGEPFSGETRMVCVSKISCLERIEDAESEQQIDDDAEQVR